MLNTQVVPGIHIWKIILRRLKWCEDQPVSLYNTVESREPGSVTNALKDLKLPSLEIRRKIKTMLVSQSFSSSDRNKYPRLYVQ